jgi:1-acyl-sn-glycerol-3-phosphate acyltransferase
MIRAMREPVSRPNGLVGRPDPRASRLYRILLGLCRAIARALRFHMTLEGAEHLPRTADGRPAGAWIAAGLPHRTWIDPFVLALLLPVEPRLHYLGDGVAMYRSWWRRLVFRRIGGIVPIWKGRAGRAFDAHVEAAKSVVDAGAVFTLFPETGPPVPVDQARPLSPGVAYFGLRTGAPIVPLVLGGTHELFLGRRIVLRVLPPVTAMELAGAARDAPAPPPESQEEKAIAHRATAALQALAAPVVADAHRAVEPPPGTRRPLRWLTHAFR